MAIRRPSASDLRQSGQELGLNLSDADAQSFLGLMQGLFDAYDVVDDMVEPLPEVKYPRTPGTRPGLRGQSLWRLGREDHDRGRRPRQARRQDDRHQGQRLRRRRADDERRLDPRGLCARDRRHHRHPPPRRGRPRSTARRSASTTAPPAAAIPRPPDRSRTRWLPATVPAARPPDPRRSWRPASSTWRLAATRAARSAFRPPSVAWSGLKPTHGLVPYTGIFAVELTVDHAGPITRTVADNALMLEVMAGPDGLRPATVGRAGPALHPCADAGRLGPAYRRGHRGLRPAGRRARGRQPGARSRRAPGQRGRPGRGDLDSPAQRRCCHLDADLPRRRDRPDDAPERFPGRT